MQRMQGLNQSPSAYYLYSDGLFFLHLITYHIIIKPRLVFMDQLSFHIRKMKSEGLLKDGSVALDLGCGSGRDTLVLAELGYRVDAVDKNNELEDKSDQNIAFTQQDITDFLIKPDYYDIIIANNSLPFLPGRETLKQKIAEMALGLKVGGKVFLTLFGPNDQWAQEQKPMSFFSYTEAVGLLVSLPLRLYWQSTEEGYGKTMKGNIKYWHIHRFLCIRA